MIRHIPTVTLLAPAILGGLTLTTGQEPTKVPDKKQITNSIGMKLVLIRPGEFMMGSHESAAEMVAFLNKTYGVDLDAAWANNEHPQHRVRITKPFYLGAYHVTVGQFRQFVTETGYKARQEEVGNLMGMRFGWDSAKGSLGSYMSNKNYSWWNVGFAQTDQHPVVMVAFDDAEAFCRWLSKKEGKTYRLPTEAEWEYACRAGTSTRYWCGDDPEKLAEVANVADASARAKIPDLKCPIRANDGYVFTSPVGSFRPNAFGLYDMHGNAWQWCSDRYAWTESPAHGHTRSEYYAKSPVDDPTGPAEGAFRVLRGGSWYQGPFDCRCARRHWIEPGFRICILGFRVARAE